MLLRVALIVSIASAPAAAREVRLEAPVEIPAGADLVAVASGETAARDFVTVVPAGHPEGQYGDYVYVRKGTATLRVPEEPGAYEVRYLEADRPFATLARSALTITPVTATVRAPASVVAGGAIEVEWTGPDNRQDFVSLIEEGGTTRRWVHYQYTKRGSPLTLRAPDEPGAYEVLYQTGGEYTVLARTPVEVTGAGATVAAPATVAAGSAVSVTWTGPGNPQDFVSLAPRGADDRGYTTWAYTKKGARLELRAPDAPGDYEIRYQTSQSYRVLARVPLSVTAVSASLTAPAEIVGGERLEVGWEGPDNAGDFIGLRRRDEADRFAAWRYTKYGVPAAMTAPLEPGEYVVTYRTGQSGTELASRPIVVAAPDLPPGELLVTAAAPFDAEDGVEVVLDASGSMLQRHEGRRRIEVAREVLLDMLGSEIPDGVGFALRVFGHREADSCRTDLEVPLAPLDAAAVGRLVAGIEAKNLAKTPIADSLARVSQDLAAVRGRRRVVLITDGEETCGGDPARAIEGLRADGTRVDIVGFHIDDAALRGSFRYWADVGGGGYFDAGSADELRAALRTLAQRPFVVADESGVVARGYTNGDPLSLRPGEYRVSPEEGSAHALTIEVESERTIRVELRE